MTMMMMMIQSHKDKDDHDDDHHHDHGEGLKEETDSPPGADTRSRQPRTSPTLITHHHRDDDPSSGALYIPTIGPPSHYFHSAQEIDYALSFLPSIKSHLNI